MMIGGASNAGIHWPPPLARCPFRFWAAVEGAVAGLLLGLIDIHSTNNDWFPTAIASFIAAMVIGVRHGGRSWQAWSLVAWCFYLIHCVAILCGYRPPYVEENFTRVIGMLPWACSRRPGTRARALMRLASSLGVGSDPTNSRASTHGLDGGKTHESARPSSVISRDPLPCRRQLRTWELMVVIALVSVHLAAIRVLLKFEPFFGMGTVYAGRYLESRFATLKFGMTCDEVEAILGPPLQGSLGLARESDRRGDVVLQRPAPRDGEFPQTVGLVRAPESHRSHQRLLG